MLGEGEGQQADGREGAAVTRPPPHAARAGPVPTISGAGAGIEEAERILNSETATSNCPELQHQQLCVNLSSGSCTRLYRVSPLNTSGSSASSSMAQKQDAIRWWLGHPPNDSLRKVFPQKSPKKLQCPEPSPLVQYATETQIPPIHGAKAHPKSLSCSLPPSHSL